jgi:hypothetical protein
MARSLKRQFRIKKVCKEEKTMGLPHLSLSTTDDVELINLSPTDISPLMSKCEIKVLYI